MVKAFSRGKMKIPSHFVNLQRSMYITSFTMFFFYSLNKTFSLALYTIDWRHIYWIAQQLVRVHMNNYCLLDVQGGWTNFRNMKSALWLNENGTCRKVIHQPGQSNQYLLAPSLSYDMLHEPLHMNYSSLRQTAKRITITNQP